MLCTSRLKLLRPLSRQTITTLATRATPELQLATCLSVKFGPIRSAPLRRTGRIHLHTSASFNRIPRSSLSPLLPSRRAFHQSPVRRDIFFVTVPAVKAVLLQLVRVTLIFLPFVSSFCSRSVSISRAKSGCCCFAGLEMAAIQSVPQSYKRTLATPSVLSVLGLGIGFESITEDG